MSSTINLTVMNEMFVRLSQFFDYGKKMAGISDDITEFFYEADFRYEEVGARRANMIDTGIFDNPDAYDTTYKNCNVWGNQRWATLGASIDGQIVTTDLQTINMGLEEFIEHSYYEPWTGGGQTQHFAPDPSGNPLSPFHPWNKVTKPTPGAQSWKEKYTWDTAPRWDHYGMEAGCYARLWNSAVARKMPDNPFIESTGHSLKMRLPRGKLPETEIEWHVPDVWNAFERNRARAYCSCSTAAPCRTTRSSRRPPGTRRPPTAGGSPARTKWP